METCPEISVVMAVYNGEPHLVEAVWSICRQTFREFEFIIINDGSTDGTAEILSRYAAEDSRIRVFTQPNAGLVASLNRGCQAARGEFIARMDADDVSLPTRLEQQIAFMRALPRIAALGSASQFIQDGALLDLYERPPLRHREIMEVLFLGNPVVHPSMLIRRAALEMVGYYRPLFVAAEDLDLWLRLGERYELANLDDVLVHRRKHAEQVTFARVVQSSMSSLAARYSSKQRRATGEDPCTRLPVINPKSLLSIGLSPAAIEAALLYTPPYRANALISRGQGDKARRILDDLSRSMAEFPSTRLGRSVIALLRAKSYRMEQKKLRWLVWTARAYSLNPRRIMEKVRPIRRPLPLGVSESRSPRPVKRGPMSHALQQ
jgi:hypothetical protein